MHARFVLIAAAALTSSSAFAADAPKAPVQPASHQQPAPAQVVLASADDVHSAPAGDQQQQAAPKRRIARVTTCRCGDPQAQPEQ